jgi:hypothetical protein
MQVCRQSLGQKAMMAYLVMMSLRLQELHVLKPTGRHNRPNKCAICLKVLLDFIFGIGFPEGGHVWRGGQ